MRLARPTRRPAPWLPCVRTRAHTRRPVPWNSSPSKPSPAPPLHSSSSTQWVFGDTTATNRRVAHLRYERTPPRSLPCSVLSADSTSSEMASATCPLRHCPVGPPRQVRHQWLVGH